MEFIIGLVVFIIAAYLVLLAAMIVFYLLFQTIVGISNVFEAIDKYMGWKS